MSLAITCPPRWGFSWIFFSVILLNLVFLSSFSSATKMHYIHWNTTNPIFRIDNTDHIIDVNKGNIRFEYDQVNIICPVYNEDARDEETEKYIIYNVSKEEYDTCRITNPSPRIIAVCDKPNRLMYFTITFRPFSPQPGGLEFRPGQDYYFISTSTKEDLHRKVGGRCNTHHMKVVFKVCCDPSSQPAHDQANGHLPSKGLAVSRNDSTTSTTKISSTTPKPTTTRTTTKYITTTRRTTSRKPIIQQINKGRKPYVNAKSSIEKKKVQKDELTRRSSGIRSISSLSPLILTAIICFLIS